MRKRVCLKSPVCLSAAGRRKPHAGFCAGVVRASIHLVKHYFMGANWRTLDNETDRERRLGILWLLGKSSRFRSSSRSSYLFGKVAI